jgi:hypothetical protein
MYSRLDEVLVHCTVLWYLVHETKQLRKSNNSYDYCSISIFHNCVRCVVFRTKLNIEIIILWALSLYLLSLVAVASCEVSSWENNLIDLSTVE